MSPQPTTEGDVRLTTQQREDLRTVLDNFGRHSITSDMLDAVERLNGTLFPAPEPAEVSGNIVAEGNSSPTVVHIHHHDIEAHAASFNEGFDEAVRQFTESAVGETKAEAVRPHTPPDHNPVTGSTRFTVQRACNRCGRDIGDATENELDACMNGTPLPDVHDECGCVSVEERGA